MREGARRVDGPSGAERAAHDDHEEPQERGKQPGGTRIEAGELVGHGQVGQVRYGSRMSRFAPENLGLPIRTRLSFVRLLRG